VIWVVDATAPANPPTDLVSGPTRLLPIVNKSDLVGPVTARSAALSAEQPAGTSPLSVSALTGAGIPELLDQLASQVMASVEGAAGAIAPTQERHRMALHACAEALTRYLAEQPPPPELAAEDLRLAADALGRITGRIDAEEVLGQIFGRFCIGK
jgi:tRNA modification GTPase